MLIDGYLRLMATAWHQTILNLDESNAGESPDPIAKGNWGALWTEGGIALCRWTPGPWSVIEDSRNANDCYLDASCSCTAEDSGSYSRAVDTSWPKFE